MVVAVVMDGHLGSPQRPDGTGHGSRDGPGLVSLVLGREASAEDFKTCWDLVGPGL